MKRAQSEGIVRMAAEPSIPYSVEKPAEAEGAGGRKAKCFLVPADEIRSNKYDLSISRYKEIEHKEIDYENPEAIMAKILDLEKAIAKAVEDIKK